MKTPFKFLLLSVLMLFAFGSYASVAPNKASPDIGISTDVNFHAISYLVFEDYVLQRVDNTFIHAESLDLPKIKYTYPITANARDITYKGTRARANSHTGNIEVVRLC